MRIIRAPIAGVAELGEGSRMAVGGGVSARAFGPCGTDCRGSLVWFHGGGWVAGQAADDDWLCSRLAGSGLSVYSVEYRLAPKHPYPAALLDGVSMLATVMAMRGASEPHKIIVGGASAGGNIAAGLALLWRDLGFGDLDGQLLVYPAVYGMEFSSFDSGIRYATGFGNDETDRQKYWDAYVGGATCRNLVYASPLSSDEFRSLPDALIISAEQDPIRDEAEEYGRYLRAAGADVTVERVVGKRHGFLTEHMSDDALDRSLFALMNTWLREQASSTEG